MAQDYRPPPSSFCLNFSGKACYIPDTIFPLGEDLDKVPDFDIDFQQGSV